VALFWGGARIFSWLTWLVDIGPLGEYGSETTELVFGRSMERFGEVARESLECCKHSLCLILQGTQEMGECQ
jgi:hypothetical protein